ncbi:MAG: hypothetical protein IJW21_06760, partial [Clostridia bacterium]|nr:hypothetical protein [Clostridia bacterium]
MNFAVKIIFILAMVLLMAAPFLFEYLVFRRDRKNGISYKRFRIMIFAALYFVVATVLLLILRELLTWVGSWGLVRWILGVMSFEEVVKYSTKLYSAILVNIVVGIGFIAAQIFVRIGLKKKKIFKAADEAVSETLSLEARVLKFFNNETWFFVSKILGRFNIVLSAIYALMFILYQIPAVFSAEWIPYEFISSVFEAGYIYPVISLILLWEAYFFFEGVKHMDAECPELAELSLGDLSVSEVDIGGIDEYCRKEFDSYFACAVEKSGAENAEIVSEHEPVSEYIASSVENDERNAKTPKEVYINCMDKIVRSEKNILFKGAFFSEFSMYFLRYLSVTLAKGDNIVFICNDGEQIDAVYNYISQGFAEISSIYSEQTGVNFDHPIWRIAKAGGEQSAAEGDIDNSSILITTLGFICTDEFERDHNEFLHLIDTIIMVDTLNTVNAYSRLLSIFNTRLEHIIKTNSLKSKNGAVNKGFNIRFMSKPVRYFCFDDGHAPGLDKVLKNLLCAEFDSADAMAVNPSTLLRCYKYDAEPGKEGVRETVHFIESDEELGAMMNMAVLCLAKGAPNVTVFADGTIPFSNITESIASNMNSLGFVVDERNLRINKYFYNPDGYSVIIALDTKNNLPATIRKYNSMTTDKPSMVIVFSRPYLFRDFYVDNIDKYWERTTQERIPVVEGTKKDIAQKILIKANAGGISENEIIDLARKIPQLEKIAEEKDINSILRSVLEEFGLTQTESLDVYK